MMSLVKSEMTIRKCLGWQRKLLFNEKQSPFPEAPDDKILGNLFNDFFIGKIEKIHLELESVQKYLSI